MDSMYNLHLQLLFLDRKLCLNVSAVESMFNDVFVLIGVLILKCCTARRTEKGVKKYMITSKLSSEFSNCHVFLM